MTGTIPRWTLEPVSGEARHEVMIPDGVVGALQHLAGEESVPLDSVLLAAHARVLAALTGEDEIVSRCSTWRKLLREVDPNDIATGESVFDPTGDGELAAGIVLRVGAVRREGRLELALRYRTDVLDGPCAVRIGGYHVTALALIAADPDAEHGRQSLLSDEEHRLQIDGLAGPRRDLPDRRVHELFEDRVVAHPDAVAAVHRDREWTYGELNARSNRLGRTLLQAGLGREGVVAVVTERNLDWMAAVLAVLKAGGVYLPIEPHFPADRIAAMLTRAGCRLVLTEPGSTANLDRALGTLSGIERVLIDDAYGQSDDTTDLGIDVAADQLAYIYFTSGSTGEPKGAMCEHGGFLNHLLAKIADLEIPDHGVVAQTAPQCFDISLWQLVAALLVGGQTRLVPQEVILDVERFVELMTGGRVNVLQVVPSYLEAVLAYLDHHPTELPDLACVSVTGEALKAELAERWFAAQPRIRLVNAYGLTETSDDTNHEVMDRPPDGSRVPLGRPIHNVAVYVVDDHLEPVPLGAPGAIVFSGICVGRGYVNDPERTAAAYLADPHRPGRRLYRTGDYGRWRPDGKLEFLGRRDSQVKIRGFRIEIGEIENTLLRIPGVGDAAVIVTEPGDRDRHLVAFYSGPQPLAADVLARRLRASLPGYMVPSAFHWHESLPCTANGKIDRKALTVLSGHLEAGTADHQAPRSATEERVAAAWGRVLGISPDRIDRRDHFFELGGTSLSAVKLAILLDRTVSLADVTAQPVLADMARLVESH